MSDQEVFREWGRSSRADVIRRRVLSAILAVGAVLAILAVTNVQFWSRNHAGVLKSEKERMQDAGVGMFEIEVRARLGEPAEVEEAPFDPRGPNGALRGPLRAFKRDPTFSPQHRRKRPGGRHEPTSFLRLPKTLCDGA